MDQAQTNGFKERLEAERRRLSELLQQTGQLNLEDRLTDSLQELSAYDNHPGDLGSETFEREKDLALRNNTREILNRVEEALHRFHEGRYGVCEECGRSIPQERLEAVPYTTYCLDCQEKEDGYNHTRQRPVEEEVLGPPFGRTFLDDTENVVYDGEDAWQDVARYGTSESPSDLGGVNSYQDMYIDAEEGVGEGSGLDQIREM